MPRLGQNPMKWDVSPTNPARVTVTTTVHIPFQDGYWEQSLNVLHLCLDSMRNNTQVPFDLMVLDNGSCSEAKTFLVDQFERGQIQYLVLSNKNLGKVGAWNQLFAAAPGEIITYTDSDVFFLNGWLEATLEILDAYPAAGLVTAQPIPGPCVGQYRLGTLAAAENDPETDIEKAPDFIAPDFVRSHRLSLGRSEEEYTKSNLKDRLDVRLTRDNTQAYIGASHFQFTSQASILKQLLPFDVQYSLSNKDDAQLDQGLLDRGYWRLMTTHYLAHHMGNIVPDLQYELPWYSFSADISKANTSAPSSQTGFWTQTRVRRLLKKINVLTYRLLYGSSD